MRAVATRNMTETGFETMIDIVTKGVLVKRIETASDGTEIITLMAQIGDSNCFIVTQEIKRAARFVEIKNIVTLSRDDIEAMYLETRGS